MAETMTRETEARRLAEPPRKFNRIALMLLGGMGLTIAIAVGFILHFIDGERERDMHAWQVRLGIVADSRAAAVNEWIDGNFAHMRELAENASLQLYLSELAAGPEDASGDDSLLPPGADEEIGEVEEGEGLDEDFDAGEAAEGYLRNLLVATAERTGFKAPTRAGEITANVERAGVAGIGLVDANGASLIATPDMPPITPRIRTAVVKALEGEPVILDVFKGPGNEPTMGFALPIFGIQDDQEGAKGIGAVIGIRILGDDLFRRLKQPGELAKSAETYIVRKSGNAVEYVTPLANETAPLAKRLDLDTPELAGAFALGKPGGFGVKRDYTSQDVLLTSRTLANVPWVLVRKVSSAEALQGTESRLRVILIVSILIIVGVTVAVFAVWRHGSSVRASQAMADMELALERFENVNKFMRVVTNSQPTEIVAVDAETHYTFANEPASRHAGISPDDMVGKTMASVMGPIRAHSLAEINKNVLKTTEREQHVLNFTREDVEDQESPEALQVIKSDHIYLRGDREHPASVLMVLEDISELSQERQRRERMLRELIDTLVSVVDRRDPYSANHSARVAEVSRAIADEMGLDDISVNTVDISGSVMNLGKIFIPPTLLTKTGQLSDEERAQLAGAYLDTVELLKGVTFDGPVVETIRQMGENWDGSGRFGISEENILPTARILAVANAFVGMVSPRAYRQAMEFRKVADILMEEAGGKFDRRPVSALVNYLENRGGAARWAHFRDTPAAA